MRISMTESLVPNQINLILNQTPQTDVLNQCKEIITDGIYTICTETGEVIDYNYDTFISNTEGLEKESKADKLYSHYRPHYALMPNRGLGTIPAKLFERKQSYYTFAFRLSLLITNSKKKSLFTRIVQKVISNKIRDKFYIISAFAVKYCDVEFDYALSILLNFLQEDEEIVKQKLSNTIKNLHYILNYKLHLSEAEYKAQVEIRRQRVDEYKYNLLLKYGYLNLLDKFSKIYNIYVIKIAVILLLLKDNRIAEAKELYESPPKFKGYKAKRRSKESKKNEESKQNKSEYSEYIVGYGQFSVKYEIDGQRYVKKLTSTLLRTLVFKHARVYSFKLRLT